VGVLLLAILVALVWLWRLRRRARLVPVDAHIVVCGMVGALAVGLFGAFTILLIHLPPGPMAILALLALLALGLLPAGWRPHLKRNVHRAPVQEPQGRPPGRAQRSRSELVLGCVGLALVAAGAAFAVTAAQREWVPPPELSIAVGQGQPVASVSLGTVTPIPARLAVVTRGRVLWSASLSSNSATQHVVLPADVLRPGSRVLLVANGRTIRSVYG